MATIPWAVPATVYKEITVQGESAQERAESVGLTLNTAIDYVLSGWGGSLELLVIRLDDNSQQFDAGDVTALAQRHDRPRRG